MNIEETIRQILQDNRIHFKNRMAMDEVGTALINGLKSFATKPTPQKNILSPATYQPREEWSPQDSKLLKDSNPGV